MSATAKSHQASSEGAFKVEVGGAPAYERRTAPLRSCVNNALIRYFNDVDGSLPDGLYHFVMKEVEQPLLETVLKYTNGNQSKAAKLLGINRGTLRKKLQQHGINS